jgi:hypothetical protein
MMKTQRLAGCMVLMLFTAVVWAEDAEAPYQPPDLSSLNRDALEILAKNLYRRVHELEQADAGGLLGELEQMKEKVRSLETATADLTVKLLKANREIVRLGGRGSSAVESTKVVDTKPGDTKSTDKEDEKKIVVFKSVKEILKVVPADLRPKATHKSEKLNTINLEAWANKNLAGQRFESMVKVQAVDRLRGGAIRLTCLQDLMTWQDFKTYPKVMARFPEERSEVLGGLDADQLIAIRGRIQSIKFRAYRNRLWVDVKLRDAEIKP